MLCQSFSCSSREHLTWPLFIQLSFRDLDFYLYYCNSLFPVVMNLLVSFVIGCDAECHDGLCGHWMVHFQSIIASLCHTCQGPTSQSRNAQADYPPPPLGPQRKLMTLSRSRVNGTRCDAAYPTTICATCAKTYLAAGVRFSLHNRQDMFGACSKEMLHLTSLLGWFKNSLEAYAIHIF